MSTNESTLPEDIETDLDYSSIAQSASFQQLLREKRHFIIPWTLFFLVFYFTLPILTSYSSVLNKIAFDSISWAWVFGTSQFIMTWFLCFLYTSRAARFDQIADSIKQSVCKGGS